MVVKMLDENLTTSQCCEEVDFDVDEEVILSALEARMWLLVDDNDYVAWDGVGCLVSLFFEGDLLAVLHALVDADLEHLAFLIDLLAITFLAAIFGVDDFTLTLTLGTGLLHLLYHGTKLAEDDLDTLTVTTVTSLDGAFLATATITLLAKDMLLQSELGDLATVELLKGDLDTVDEILALARATRSRASSTEEATSAATEEL